MKFAYLQKALSLINSELELLLLKIQHPEQFQPSEQIFISNLHIVPKSKDLGIIAIGEIVVGLYLSGKILGADGKPATLIRIAKAFEWTFNLSFGDIYDKQDEVFKRKPYNLTKALDFLRSTILREDRKRNNR